MKRHGNLYEKFISDENIINSIESAINGKKDRRDVKKFLNHIGAKTRELKTILENGWIPSGYTQKIIKDKGKNRTLSIPPFFPDRIIHHMINNILNGIYIPILIKDTYQCIQGRGTHKAVNKTLEYIRIPNNTWVMKIDISKYYPSVDNEVLKQKLGRKIKDPKFKTVLYTLIDSHKGLPLGNHTSQLLGNIYLNDLDHSMKQLSKYYIRYADDIVIFGDKVIMVKALNILSLYCNECKLILNPSTQYFNLSKRYLNFLGFRFYKYGINSSYIRPKKSKLVFRELLAEQKASMYGWIKESKASIYIVKIFFEELNSRSKHFIKDFFRSSVFKYYKYNINIKEVYT